MGTHLFVFAKDVGNGFGILEVVVEVFLKAVAKVLSPCMFGGFPREEGYWFRLGLVEIVGCNFELGLG